MLKKVAAVPSGPTKLNGPNGELLAAAWKRSVVPAGVEPFHESEVQTGDAPGYAFDRMGSYDAPILGAALLSFIGAAAVYVLARSRKWAG